MTEISAYELRYELINRIFKKNDKSVKPICLNSIHCIYIPLGLSLLGQSPSVPQCDYNFLILKLGLSSRACLSLCSSIYDSFTVLQIRLLCIRTNPGDSQYICGESPEKSLSSDSPHIKILCINICTEILYKMESHQKS